MALEIQKLGRDASVCLRGCGFSGLRPSVETRAPDQLALGRWPPRNWRGSSVGAAGPWGRPGLSETGLPVRCWSPVARLVRQMLLRACRASLLSSNFSTPPEALTGAAAFFAWTWWAASLCWSLPFC